MNENMEFPNLSGSDIEWLQQEFVNCIRERIEVSKADRRTKKEDQGKVRHPTNYLHYLRASKSAD